MQRLAFSIVLTLSLALASALAHAAIELTPTSSGASLNDQIELLEDTSGQLTIADMADPTVQNRFTPANGRATVGQSRNPWWIKVTLRRTADAPTQWWLENAGITIFNLQLYLPNGQGGWTVRETGEAVPYLDGRDYAYRRMVFQLPEIGEQPLTLYFRSLDPAGNSFPLKIWQLPDLAQLAGNENIGFGLIYGVILALLLYNLFILVALRDRAYFWYVMATACVLVFILSMTGHGAQYLWPDNAVPFWLDRITLPALWGIFVMRFTQELLYTKRGLAWPHRLLNAGCALYVTAIVINAFGYRAEGALMIALTPIVTVPMALLSAGIRCYQGFIPSRFYLLGYGAVLASTVVLVMRAAGLIEPSNFTAYLFPISVAAETILFSFALAYRIQMLKLEKAEALQQADREKTARLAQAQANAAELKHSVEQRTAELAATNERLLQRESELQHAAFHDPLTELPNRRFLVERCEAALANARRHNEATALLLIDLDHFKPINDKYGHDAGDLMLQTIAQRLREHVRSGDAVARLGGDEFAVLICGEDAEQHAREIARRLLDELAKPVAYGADRLTVTISIGVALYPRHASNFTTLYKAADEMLYKVKGRGRSGSAVCGEDGELSSSARLQLDVLNVPSGLS
ncbi:diguanylate cyclase [Pseudomonas sp. WS 5011]|uniref:diguanylate cyclase domain-containing protein n=1 Tax=Pseudomonas sp. WS 5011 TaxID=2717477 RepID=UPI001473077A|nr:diguanylate cyclase [Pseudomonas sp. WS 5011]